MADRFRRPDLPDHVACPRCIGGKLKWYPFEEGKVIDRFGVWECDLCKSIEPLIHWLTPGATRRLHTEPDTFGDSPEYVERQDVMSDKAWWQRQVNGHQVARQSRRAGIYQVAYTQIQYQLIRWAMWMHENKEWHNSEIYQILKYFWPQEFGQTPLVSRTVFAWMSTRKAMMKKGLEWP
jgi:hypothetical protein